MAQSVEGESLGLGLGGDLMDPGIESLASALNGEFGDFVPLPSPQHHQNK